MKARRREIGKGGWTTVDFYEREINALSYLLQQGDVDYDIHTIGMLVVRKDSDAVFWEHPHQWCVEIDGVHYGLDVRYEKPRNFSELFEMLAPWNPDCGVCSQDALSPMH